MCTRWSKQGKEVDWASRVLTPATAPLASASCIRGKRPGGGAAWCTLPSLGSAGHERIGQSVKSFGIIWYKGDLWELMYLDEEQVMYVVYLEIWCVIAT